MGGGGSSVQGGVLQQPHMEHTAFPVQQSLGPQCQPLDNYVVWADGLRVAQTTPKPIREKENLRERSARGERCSRGCRRSLPSSMSLLNPRPSRLGCSGFCAATKRLVYLS